MSDFYERFGHITVGETLELNKAAQATCEHEITCQTEEVDNETV